MKAGFYSGASGLQAQQKRLDNIGNNLANVNTAGYKAEKTGFQNLVYTYMDVNTNTNPLAGHGVRLTDLGTDQSQGTLKSTGGLLDFAIQGNGMFAVQINGNRQYTRNGTFDVGLANGVPYLTTTNGAFVLDNAGNPIQIPQTEDGNLDVSGLVDRIGVYCFDRPGKMNPVSGTAYQPTQASGAARLAVRGQDYTIMQGAVEQSNVQMQDEMTDMIMAQRAFQISARVVQTEDEIEQNVNSLRG